MAGNGRTDTQGTAACGGLYKKDMCVRVSVRQQATGKNILNVFDGKLWGAFWLAKLLEATGHSNYGKILWLPTKKGKKEKEKTQRKQNERRNESRKKKICWLAAT